jgi:hypothetical protein
LGKEPPKASDTPFKLAPPANRSGLEQLNIKVPRGTKERLRRLCEREGGLSMRRLFTRMVEAFEQRHHD